MQKIRFGIIGLGNQGSSYVFNICDDSYVQNTSGSYGSKQTK